MAKSTNLIIVPAPGHSHLVSIIEFANILLRRDDRFSISVLVINPPFTAEGLFTKKLSDSHPAISFIDVPRVDPAPLISNPTMAPEAFVSSYIELHKPNVRAAVEKLVIQHEGASTRFVVDMFCTSMLEVARGFGWPGYTFFASSAAFLGLLQFMSARSVFCEDDPDALIPAYARPVPTSVLPTFVFRKDGYDAFAAHGERIRETDGVIINTFADLEPHALRSFGDGFPPLYPIGPVLDLAGANQLASETKKAESERILRWLDEQEEEESVVFLCFGSMGSFNADQVAEIAAGLENSRVKFLWSLRKPPQPGESKWTTSDFKDPNEILPEGFLARTEGRGLICGWAPQAKILAHKSVGGFVTHCGWNSILESIWFGVPTATWPLYAEQQVNAFQMVKDLELAVELKMDYRHGQEALVSAAEVENAVKLLMSVDGHGLEMRKRVKKMSERSRAAVAEGGSSLETIEALISKM
uniref:Glycosyltransferase n=1 Tax=Kalanchoe fedtschenkoi TaxID=63787 RepID=A0A7N0TYK4_KALFE